MTAPMAAPAGLAGRPMALLAGGVPLSLLMDLVCGPPSRELLTSERPGVRAMPAPRPA